MARPVARPYMKLDLDWYNDPKFIEFQERCGKAKTLDVIKLFCLMQEFGGHFLMGDPVQMAKVRHVLGMKGKRLDDFLLCVAESGLIRKDWFLQTGIVGSDRAARDACARRDRKRYAWEAAEAAARKRAEESAEPDSPADIEP